MVIEINGKEYALSTKLGVVKDIQAFNANKTYTEILNGLATAGIEEQLSVVFASLKRGGLDMKRNEFNDWAYDNLEIADVLEAARWILENVFKTKGSVEVDPT